MRGADALAAVLHGDLHLCAHRPRGHRDGAACGRVAQRIGKQILQDLHQPRPVGLHEQWRTGQGAGQRDSLGLGQRRKEFDGILHQGRHIDRTQRQRQLARLGLRQLVQVVDQAVQMARLVIEAGDLRLVQRVDIVQDRTQVALQHGERRAQFVRHVGQHVLAQLLGLLQVCGHVIEGLRQPDHLIAAFRRHPHRQIAGADLRGAGGQIVQRCGHAPAHPRARGNAQNAAHKDQRQRRFQHRGPQPRRKISAVQQGLCGRWRWIWTPAECHRSQQERRHNHDDGNDRSKLKPEPIEG